LHSCQDRWGEVLLSIVVGEILQRPIYFENITQQSEDGVSRDLGAGGRPSRRHCTNQYKFSKRITCRRERGQRQFGFT
jgi:hypothetical protein